MRLGIMGGTFNPIHNGHLFIAEEARAHFRLDQVIFVPNGAPPHKETVALAAAVHRYAMTRCAIGPNPAFECSSVELNRPGLSYTIDTLDLLRAEHPEADFFYITGADAIADLLTWKRHAEVIQRTEFIAARRPGFDLDTLQDRLPGTYREHIHLLTSMALGVSSTDIRLRVQQGQPIRYLTPDAVVDYIERHCLYRDPAGPDAADHSE